MFTRFIYLCLFWFRIVYLHPGFVYLHFSMFVYRISALFTNTGLFICTFNVYIQSFRLVYKHWFVYLHFQCLYTKFSPCLQILVCLFILSIFIYKVFALFTNTGLFIYVFQRLYTNFRLVYKHRFVYLRFPTFVYKFPLCLQTLLCLFTFSNVCIQSFRFVYKHCFVYLRFPMFVCKVSALFTNIGLFIYIFCVCLLLECKQTCCRLVARFLEICFRWLVK